MANIGCVPGKSGLVIVDIDGPQGEEEALQYGLDEPPTRCSITGKGRHLWYAHPGKGNIGNRKPGGANGKIDIRADAGYVLFPGSIHPDGPTYQWRLGGDLRPQNILPLPLPFLAILRGSQSILGTPRGTPVSFLTLESITEGSRHARLTQVAGRLFAKGLGAEEVYALLSGYNAQFCLPPKGDYEVRAITEAIGRKELEKRALLMPDGVASIEGDTGLRVGLGDWIQLAQDNMKPIRAIPTPFPTWNAACQKEGGRIGPALGWHIVLAGKSGIGKTTLMMNLAAHATLLGKKVGIISLEQSKRQLMANVLPMVTGIHASLLEPSEGNYNNRMLEEAEKYHGILDKVGGGLYIVDRPKADLRNILLVAGQMIDEGCTVIFTDYMQKVKVSGADEKETAIKVSGALQNLAFEKQVLSYGLSQFGRATTSQNIAPTAEGLYGSSALENDSDQIMMLDHSSYQISMDGTQVNIMFKLGKNRHGPKIEIPGMPVSWKTSDFKMYERR